MNELELLVLRSSTTAEDYIITFSNIIDDLDMVKSSLLLAYWVQSFIKGIINPLHTSIVYKVRDILTSGSHKII